MVRQENDIYLRKVKNGWIVQGNDVNETWIASNTYQLPEIINEIEGEENDEAENRD